MNATYRGYEIKLTPERCGWLTMWTFKIYYTGSKRRLVAEGDGGTYAEEALRSAKSKINAL